MGGRVIASLDDLQYERSRILMSQYNFSFGDLFSSYNEILAKVRAIDQFSIEAFSFENQPINIHDRYIYQTLCAAVVSYEMSRSSELIFQEAVGEWRREGNKLKRAHLIAKITRKQAPELYELMGLRFEMLADDLKKHRTEYLKKFIEELNATSQ